MKKSHTRSGFANGFTIVELLVSMSILSVLLGLMIPAIQQSREAARRMSCQSNLRQLMTATASFEATHGMLPPGTSHKLELLPHLGESALYERAMAFINSQAAITEANPVQDTLLSYFMCPSDSGEIHAQGLFGFSYGTNYHGNAGNGVLGHGFNGVFGYGDSTNDIYPDHPVRCADIQDGLSNTAAFSEAILPNPSYGRIARVWRSSQEYFQPSEMTDLIQSCEAVTATDSQDVEALVMFPRGFPWPGGGMGTALYTHTLTPNRTSCTNGDSVMTGLYTATSLHPGGVNVAFADGHVEFISQHIDATVWADMGSRAPLRLQFPF